MTIAAAAKPQRIAALDFTKGALVLIMVLYHWLNYFVGSEGDYYKYLRFLPPSFIFIAGFLISNVYLSRYGGATPRLGRRLAFRGLKILGVFVALNVARSFVLPSLAGNMPDTHLSIRDLITICLNGNIVHADGGKAIAFYILMPIGYLLLLSAVLLVVYRFYRYVFHVVCAAFLLLIFILNAHGVDNGNLELLTIGLVGLLCGFVSTEKINGMVRHSYVLTGAYLAYTAAISIWNVPYLLQIVGVGLSVIMLYMLGAWSGSSGTVAQQIILLGKYSLYGYIAQIVILQVLHRGLRRFDLGIGLLSISFVAACGLTMISVMAVDRARARAGAVNWLYKAVFA